MSKGAGLKKSVGTQASEKLTFRCPGCNALLSSRKIEKRSRLTCPKCSEKIIINPDGSAELLTKRAPHMKKMDIPQKQKAFSDQDLERLLDFGETQPIGKDAARPAPKPRPPSGRKEPAAPAPKPAAVPAPAPPDAFSGPQYLSEEDEERKKFLDQVQGPGGKRPGTGVKTLDAEIPSPPVKKAPPARKKLTKFGTDRRKTESVEDRLVTAKTKRAATRNKILAVIFIILPLLVGVIAYYNASRPVEEGKEESGFARLIKSIGAKTEVGALAINERVLRLKPPEQPEKPAEQPEKPVEQPEKPVEQPEKPAEQPEKPAEQPEKPAEQPEKPVEQPEKPAEQPEKPAEQPEQPKDEQEAKVKKCPKCGRTVLKDDEKCGWCGYEFPPPPKKDEAPKDDSPPSTH
jgi:DNA-directed RNA polymerase subunit RPC12/RpoP